MPEEGRRKPDIMWRRVLLPAPLGPRRPVMPGPMLKEMSFTATRLPYQRDTGDFDRGVAVHAWTLS